MKMKMNVATRAALEKSIEKWQEIADGSGTDEGSRNCALCGLFLAVDCRGCPVAVATGKTLCDGSPYVRWGWAFSAAEWLDGSRRADTSERKAAARAELEFLQGLFPAKRRART